MDDLERRALMGDPQAQEECTRLGIVLSCPCCRGNATVHYTANNSYPNGYTSNIYTRSKPGFIMCNKCGLKTAKYMKACRALARWNTRPAPPYRICKDCGYGYPSDKEGCVVCAVYGCTVENDNSCKQFGPKEK